MALEYDAKALRKQVSAMFERNALSGRGRAEKCLVAALVHEYTSLEHAAAQDAREQKTRIVVVTRTEEESGVRFYVHKGKERGEHGMQIGRTWPLDSFTSLDVLTPDSPLLVPGFHRLYFWVFASAPLRHDFETVLRKIYYSLTGLNVPIALAPPPVPQVSRRRTVSRNRSPRSASLQQHPIQYPQPLQMNQPNQPFQNHPQNPSQHPQMNQTHTQMGPALPQMNQTLPQMNQVGHNQMQMNQMNQMNQMGQMGHQHPMNAQQMLPQQLQPHPTQQHASQPPQIAPIAPIPLPNSQFQQRQVQHPFTPIQASLNASLAGISRSQTPHTPNSSQRPQSPQKPAHSLSQPSSSANLHSKTVKQPEIDSTSSASSAASSSLQPPLSVPEKYTDKLQSPAKLGSPLPQRKNRPVLPPLNVNFDAPNTLMSPIHSPAPKQPNSASTNSTTVSTAGSTSGSIAPLRPGVYSGPQSAFPGSKQQLASPLEPEIAVPVRSRSRRLNRLSLPQPSMSPEPQSPLKSPINARMPFQTSLAGLNASNAANSGNLGNLGGLNSANAANSSQTDTPNESLAPVRVKMRNLNQAINECKWDGQKVDSLQSAINRKLSELADQNFSGVVSVDSQSQALEQLVSASLQETHQIDHKMKTVAMNLAGLGSDIKHIEGQGDGLQVLTVSYRSLAQEIEKVLACAQIDESFVDSFTALQFPNPNSKDLYTSLNQCEHELKRLFKCLRLLSKLEDGEPMHALKKPNLLASKAAETVSEQFVQFFTSNLRSLKPSDDPIELQMLKTFYIYCSCVLFVQGTCPNVYKHLLKSYERTMSQLYCTQWTSSVKSMQLQIDKVCVQRRDTVCMSSDILAQEFDQTAQKYERVDLKPIKLPLPALDKLYALMQHFLNKLGEQIFLQRHFVKQFFHIGLEDSLNYLEYIKRFSLPSKRIEHLSSIASMINTTGSNNGATTSFNSAAFNSTAFNGSGVPPSMLASVFSASNAIITEFVDSFAKKVPLEIAYLLAALDAQQSFFTNSNQYISERLKLVYSATAAAYDQFMKQETKTILGAHFITKKRVGMHPVVLRFTEQVAIVEHAYERGVSAQLKNGGNKPRCSESRELLDSGHTSVFRAIAQGLRMGADTTELVGSVSTAARLKAAAKETAGGNSGEEAKYLLNRHVVMIENLYRICTDLEMYTSPGIKSIVKDARQNYNRELNSYITDVLSRPLSKVYQFIHNNEARCTQASKHKEILSQLKRTAQIFEAKDVRKNIEVLKRRVEKHFVEAADKQVFLNVWRVIGEQYESVFDRVYKIAVTVDGVNYLLVQRSDIASAFE